MKKDHRWALKLIVPSSCLAIAHIVNISKKKRKKKGKQTTRQQKLLKISKDNIQF